MKIWELGPHRLGCGDAGNEKDIDVLLNGEFPSLVVTSPPYNQGMNRRLAALQKSRPGKFIEASRKSLIKMAAAYKDDMPEEDYQNEQIKVLNLLFEKTGEKASLYYNHKLRYRDKACVHPMNWVQKTKWILRQEIIWDRSSSIVQNARMFIPQDERIYWLVKGKQFVFSETCKKYGTIWPIFPVNAIKNDGLPFPNKLAARCILASSIAGDLVMDPYGGAGTVLIEADRLGRKCAIIEIDQRRCEETILPRWAEWLENKKGAHDRAP